MLTTLIPVRDPEERVTGYFLASTAIARTPAAAGRPAATDVGERARVEQVGPLTRLAGKPLIVPVSAAMVLDGVLTRFASTEATWVLPLAAFSDDAVRRVIDRLAASEFRFGIDSRADGNPVRVRLPEKLEGSVQLLDAAAVPLPKLLDTMAKGMVLGVPCGILNVDDRATRRRLLDAGAVWTCGRALPRGGRTIGDRVTDERALRVVLTLAQYSDGRPPDDRLEALFHDDRTVAEALVKALHASKLGRPGRPLSQEVAALGRDALLNLMVIVGARLLGEAARDPEVALAALRRARAAQRISAVLESPPHPRACTMAGLLSTVDYALGVSLSEVAEMIPRTPVLLDALGARQRGLGEVLDLIEAMEVGWWDEVLGRCALLQASPAVVADGWRTAWRTATEELGIVRTEG
ncbi:MAG: hypothetical protein KJT01_13495 [Gemmatimonadetes bacterium]|nr:hypothetical protein [Gemmatimonadota bacterium]